MTEVGSKEKLINNHFKTKIFCFSKDMLEKQARLGKDLQVVMSGSLAPWAMAQFL